MTNVLMLSSILLVFLCFLVQLSYENYANILHLHHSHPSHYHHHLHSPSPHSPLLSPATPKGDTDKERDNEKRLSKEREMVKATTRMFKEDKTQTLCFRFLEI
ncbi:hypothetical protein BKA57DRAFT_436481 [Linnemannia elongata]|nr:hypothetical protein BKA57DRAFT_436481 [Linnemannia elongata]